MFGLLKQTKTSGWSQFKNDTVFGTAGYWDGMKGAWNQILLPRSFPVASCFMYNESPEVMLKEGCRCMLETRHATSIPKTLNKAITGFVVKSDRKHLFVLLSALIDLGLFDDLIGNLRILSLSKEDEVELMDVMENTESLNSKDDNYIYWLTMTMLSAFVTSHHPCKLSN